MHYLYSLVAMDIAAERNDVFSLEFEHDWEARAARRAAEVAAAGSARPSLSRRALALVLAAVSRGTAATARRLDAVTADDLGRTLAHTD